MPSPSILAMEEEAEGVEIPLANDLRIIQGGPRQYYYLSGPMSGYPKFNFPAFEAAGKDLRERGYDIVSPAELEDPDDAVTVPGDLRPTLWNTFLARDLDIVISPECIGVICLPEWEQSKGARLEVHVARELGKEILKYPDLTPIPVTSGEPENILEEANRAVAGQRGADYGHPYHDFSRTAQIMSAILGVEVQVWKVPLLMMAVKLSRQCNARKRDNLVDIAGYARTAEMVDDFLENHAAQ